MQYINYIDIDKFRKEMVDIPENVIYIFSALIATFTYRTCINYQKKHFFIVRLNFPGFKTAIFRLFNTDALKILW